MTTNPTLTAAADRIDSGEVPPQIPITVTIADTLVAVPLYKATINTPDGAQPGDELTLQAVHIVAMAARSITIEHPEGSEWGTDTVGEWTEHDMRGITYQELVNDDFVMFTAPLWPPSNSETTLRVFARLENRDIR